MNGVSRAQTYQSATPATRRYQSGTCWPRSAQKKYDCAVSISPGTVQMPRTISAFPHQRCRNRCSSILLSQGPQAALISYPPLPRFGGEGYEERGRTRSNPLSSYPSPSKRGRGETEAGLPDAEAAADAAAAGDRQGPPRQRQFQVRVSVVDDAPADDGMRHVCRMLEEIAIVEHEIGSLPRFQAT